jgi:hypothetical protein
MLVATPGIIVSSQNTFAAVSQNGINNPPTKAGNGGFPANAQGVCYAQGAVVAGAVTGSPAGNTQQPLGHGTGGAAASHQHKDNRYKFCPPPP